MCRSIHTLHNFEPPATEEEMRAAAVQYVRKVSGYISGNFRVRLKLRRAQCP